MHPAIIWSLYRGAKGIAESRQIARDKKIRQIHEKRLETDPVYRAEYERSLEEAAREQKKGDLMCGVIVVSFLLLVMCLFVFIL